MTTEHKTRLLGARDGLASAIVVVYGFKSSVTGPSGCYLPPKHHTKKRAAALAKLADLERIEKVLKRKLDEVKTAIAAV